MKANLKFIPIIGILISLLFASCKGSQTLTVGDWAGYEEEQFWAGFKNANPDTAVEFKLGYTNNDIIGFAERQEVDIVHIYAGWLQMTVDDELVVPIDVTRLSNWKDVPENFKQLGKINGVQYFVPYDWGYDSIIYRTDLVDNITSWSDLMDPKYRGHVSMINDSVSAIVIGAAIHDWDISTLTPEQLAVIKAEWFQQKELNNFYWNTEAELVNAMAKGDVWIAFGWQGAYATLLDKGVPVKYATLKEKRISWVGFYGITKSSANYDLALNYINQQLGLTAGTNLVRLYNYGHANRNVMDNIKSRYLIEAFSLNNPEVMTNTNTLEELTREQQKEWLAIWNEITGTP